MSPSRIAERRKAITNANGRLPDALLVELLTTVLRQIESGGEDPKHLASAALGGSVFDIKNEIATIYGLLVDRNYDTATAKLKTLFQRLP